MPDSIPPPPDVTLGEIWRTVKRIEKQLDSLQVVTQLQYGADQRAMGQRIDAVAEDVVEIKRDAAANRRMIWTSIIAPVIMLIVGVVVTASVVAP